MKTLFFVLLILLMASCAEDVTKTKTVCTSDGVYTTCMVQHNEQ